MEGATPCNSNTGNTPIGDLLAMGTLIMPEALNLHACIERLLVRWLVRWLVR